MTSPAHPIGVHFSGSSNVVFQAYADSQSKRVGRARVPLANATVTFLNATLTESKLSDANGQARFTLLEKMMNATGNYSVGNYTVEATYEIYLDTSSMNMTRNKQITLILEGFVIPEFLSFLILLLFMGITLLAVRFYRRGRSV